MYKTNSFRRNFSAVVAVATTVFFGAASPAQNAATAGQNVLPNGNFEALGANGRPTGWDAPSRNSRVVSENGNRYMVISRVTGEELPWLGLTLPLDPAWKRMRLSAKMRVRDLKLGTEAWQNARVGLRWEDETGKKHFRTELVANEMILLGDRRPHHNDFDFVNDDGDGSDSAF